MAGPLRVLDLFSGIGGFSLGLERAGMTTVAFCEIDPFCRRVLAKHWPDVPCHHDITKLEGDHVGAVDVVCGGFPCQDISVAGKGAGLAGERSGLFYEFARLIGELRPRYAILENVSGLLSRGLGDVLGELASLGYDAEWHCIPASAVGAPHRRDRIWIVSYPHGERREQLQHSDRGDAISPDAIGTTKKDQQQRDRRECRSVTMGGVLSNAISQRLAIWQGVRRNNGTEQPTAERNGCFGHVADTESDRWTTEGQRTKTRYPNWSDQLRCGTQSHWDAEPDVGRVADGVPSRTHRLRALGNAVVPQIPELIGRAILAVDGRT